MCNTILRELRSPDSKFRMLPANHSCLLILSPHQRLPIYKSTEFSGMGIGILFNILIDCTTEKN